MTDRAAPGAFLTRLRYGRQVRHLQPRRIIGDPMRCRDLDNARIRERPFGGGEGRIGPAAGDSQLADGVDSGRRLDVDCVANRRQLAIGANLAID